MTYDGNGNLGTANGWTYTYDYENRLIGANNASTTASYGYDPFGRRISKTVDGVVTNFVYDGDQIIAEYDGAGVLQKKYVYGSGIDEPVLMQSGANKYWYNRDGLGSISEITNNSGVIVEKYSYDAYGKTTIRDASDEILTTSSIGNRYGFTGRELDSETGLYHYRARAYSPDLGRFLQTDPLQIEDINPYTYCWNGPTNYVDPYGFWGEKEVKTELDKYFGDRLSEETKKKIADYTGKHIGYRLGMDLQSKKSEVSVNAKAVLEEAVRKSLVKEKDETIKKAFEEYEKLKIIIETEKLVEAIEDEIYGKRQTEEPKCKGNK